MRILSDPWSAAINADLTDFPLTLRPRQPGDRFQPQGAGGSQKLGDFQTNQKIPLIWRDHLPLLTTNREIIWVCGWRVDEGYIVTPETKTIWLARFWRE